MTLLTLHYVTYLLKPPKKEKSYQTHKNKLQNPGKAVKVKALQIRRSLVSTLNSVRQQAW